MMSIGGGRLDECVGVLCGGYEGVAGMRYATNYDVHRAEVLFNM